MSSQLRSSLVDLPSIPYRKPGDAKWQSEHGSAEEERFLREVAPRVLGTKLLPFLHMQVPLSSLVDDADGGQVDFALICPSTDWRAVVIEIDGDQHLEPASAESDAARDQLLERAGHIVVRIPAREIREFRDGALQELREVIRKVREGGQTIRRLDPRATAAAHAQTTLLHLLATGRLDPGASSWTIELTGDAATAMRAGLASLRDLVEALCDLYGTDLWPKESSFDVLRPQAERGSSDASVDAVLHWSREPWFAQRRCNPGLEDKTFALRPCWLPGLATIPAGPAGWCEHQPTVSTRSLTHLLHVAFPGKAAFWEGQQTGLRRALAGDDSLVLLPTGGGKSLIYQLAALLTQGLSLVVSPLVALMEDQKDNLARAGIDRVVTISSHTTAQGETWRLQRFLDKGALLLCYVSPERMQIRAFREALVAVVERLPIPAVIVDEAHCVSEWGHDFRPAYLNLARIARNFGRRGHGEAPALHGLTGTASRSVLRDVSISLSRQGPESVMTPERMDRPELTIEVRKVHSAGKRRELKRVLDGMPEALGIDRRLFFANEPDAACGIVFCPHVGGDFGVTDVARFLRSHGYPEAKVFHGKLENNYRARLAGEFKDNRFNLLVATKAFGMGIDKPNIRFTVHYCMPSSIESFYQEAGRAGRDGRPARCVVLQSVDHPQQAQRLLRVPATKLRELIADVSWASRDDITRCLYFFSQAFPGPEDDLRYIEAVLSQFSSERDGARERVLYQETGGSGDPAAEKQALTRVRAEKALHRLALLNIVRDYTVDYSARRIDVERGPVDASDALEQCLQYVSLYNADRARALKRSLQPRLAGRGVGLPAIFRGLLDFIYETIEAARREAVATAWRWTELPSLERESFLRDYLDTQSGAAQRVSSLAGSGQSDRRPDWREWEELISEAASARDLDQLRAAIDREIDTSHPDSPPLFAVRAVLASMSDGKSAQDEMMNAALRCMEYLRVPYGVAEEIRASRARWIVRNVVDRGQPNVDVDGLVHVLTDEDVDREGAICRELDALDLPSSASKVISRRLLRLLNDELAGLVRDGFKIGGEDVRRVE